MCVINTVYTVLIITTFLKTTKTTNEMILHIHVLTPLYHLNFVKRKMQINLVYHSGICYHLVDTFLLSFQYWRVWFILYREVHFLRKENIVNCFTTNYHTPIIFQLFNKQAGSFDRHLQGVF